MITVILPNRRLGIEFSHRMTLYNPSFPPFEPVKVKGTQCEIYALDINGLKMIPKIARGEAMCQENDQFCKAIGRKIALTHALEDYVEFSKYERGKIWEAYWNRG